MTMKQQQKKQDEKKKKKRREEKKKKSNQSEQGIIFFSNKKVVRECLHSSFTSCSHLPCCFLLLRQSLPAVSIRATRTALSLCCTIASLVVFLSIERTTMDFHASDARPARDGPRNHTLYAALFFESLCGRNTFSSSIASCPSLSSCVTSLNNRLGDFAVTFLCPPSPKPFKHISLTVFSQSLFFCSAPSVTGTSVLAVKYQGGVMLAADTLGKRSLQLGLEEISPVVASEYMLRRVVFCL
jgi:hypothetical protein